MSVARARLRCVSVVRVGVWSMAFFLPKSRVLIDLWDLASELWLTPRDHDGGGTASAVRRRRQYTVVLWSGIAVIIVAAISLWPVIGHAPRWGQLPASAIVVGIAMVIIAGIQLLSANTYRRFSALGARFATPLWWTFAITTLVLATVACLAAVANAGTPVDSAVLVSKTTVALLGLSAVMLAMLTSSSAAPLIAAAPRPRRYQVHVSVTLWTVSLIALIVSVTPFAIWPEQESTLVALTLTLAAGLIASAIAWQRRSIGRVEAERRELVNAVIDVRTAWRVHRSTATMLRTLRRLDACVTPSSFRSQSIASTPLVARWEITEIVRLLLWSIGDGAMPDSITARATIDEPLGTMFRGVRDASRREVRAAAPAFLDVVYRRLVPDETTPQRIRQER